MSYTYDNWAYTWQKGRQLAKMANAARGFEVQYTYNVDGLRVGKKVVWYDQPDVDAPQAGETTYTLNGKQILHMDCCGEKLDFDYGAQGKPAFVRYGGQKYAYVYNLQDDVVALLASTGKTVVQYEYDAWGKPVTMTGELADTLGRLNPFRYRGYVFDEETGLYYLRSRYYDPVWGRFVNADSIAYITPEKFGGNNLFTYCNSDPVDGYDPHGTFDWSNFCKGTSWLTIGIAAFCVGVSILTCGVATPAMMAVAAVTTTAGAMTGINGTSEIGEALTGHNFVRDDVFGRNGKAYDIYANTTAAVADVGTAICGGWTAKNMPRINAYNHIDKYQYTITISDLEHMSRPYANSILTQKQVIKYGKMTEDSFG